MTAISEARLKELIHETHVHGVHLAEEIRSLTHDERALEQLNARRRRELAAKEHHVNIPMFDTIEVGTVPPNAVAVAGYVGGHWPTYHELVLKFPHAKHLSIAVNAGEDADCLDIETGDAVPDEAPAWVARQRARGVKRPCLYANLSTMPAVEAALTHASIGRHTIRLWVAHYTFIPHIESGYDGCQWTDRALGRNLDESLLVPNFFD